MNPPLRVVREAMVLVALLILPPLIAGCASAVARQSPAEVPEATGNGRDGHASSEDATRPWPGENFAGAVPLPSWPSPGEELWVIEKPAATKAPKNDDALGGGALVTRSPRGDVIPVPLRHTDVKASVTGCIATVDVTQEFYNPYDGKIEAVYVFPLPHNAAVSDFLMTIGERRIRGIVRERQEAEQIYREAKGQGYVASLLTQERPNVFTQAVANIEPGKRIHINVRYNDIVTYADGWHEFAFPMVVGPRFNPAGAAGGIGAAGNGRRGTSGQTTEVSYLRPGERSGHDVSLALRLDAGLAVDAVESRSHVISVRRPAPTRADVTLDPSDRIPNRDFVLRWKIAGDQVRSGLVVQRDGRDGSRGG